MMLGLVTALLVVFGAPVDESKEEALLTAVRKGDLAAVQSLLDQGVAVDTKFRYDRTALSFAADRGYVDVVKLLLARGADVNAKDSFYGATALVWALEKSQVEVVRLLLEKGAKGGEDALETGVEKGNLELVKLALEKAAPTPEELSAALGTATKQGQADIVEALRRAGAVPLPKADFKVDLATLAAYAGTYKPATGQFLITLVVKGSTLQCTTCGPSPVPLGAVDTVTFRPSDAESRTLVFKREGEKVSGFTLRQGRQETFFARVEDPKP